MRLSRDLSGLLHSSSTFETALQVPRSALKAPFRDGTVQDLAKKVLALSRQGLEARGLQEAQYLQPLEEIAESGLTCADRLLAEYSGKWEEQIDRVYSPEHSF